MNEPKKLKSIKYSLDGVDVELIPKIGITNYIQERIEDRKRIMGRAFSKSWNEKQREIISELQAVLSKIEELGIN